MLNLSIVSDSETFYSHVVSRMFFMLQKLLLIAHFQSSFVFLLDRWMNGWVAGFNVTFAPIRPDTQAMSGVTK